MLGLGAAYVHAGMRAGLAPGARPRPHRAAHDPGDRLPADTRRLPLGLRRRRGRVAGLGQRGHRHRRRSSSAAPRPNRCVLGRLQPPALGVAAAAWDTDGQPVIGQPGELVITSPMPSMPLYFWNDPDGSRYRDSYFSTWPGVWRHGDLVEFDDRRQLGDPRTIGLHTEPQRHPDGSGRPLPGGRGAAGGARRRSSWASRRTTATTCRCSCSSHDGVDPDEATDGHPGRHPCGAVAPVRARRHHRGLADPAHAHGQEARGAGQADCSRAIGWRTSSTRAPSTTSPSSPRSATAARRRQVTRP